jgi:hypothetical protein
LIFPFPLQRLSDKIIQYPLRTVRHFNELMNYTTWSKLSHILLEPVSRLKVDDCSSGAFQVAPALYYSSRSVIILIYFPWNVISKQCSSWTVMRPISPTQRCVSGNVYKQTSPEITCMRRTIMGFLHETSLIWVISLGWNYG